MKSDLQQKVLLLSDNKGPFGHYTGRRKTDDKRGKSQST